MEITSNFAVKQVGQRRPDTFGEFFRLNAIDAIRELFEPFDWLKSLFMLVKSGLTRLLKPLPTPAFSFVLYKHDEKKTKEVLDLFLLDSKSKSGSVSKYFLAEFKRQSKVDDEMLNKAITVLYRDLFQFVAKDFMTLYIGMEDRHIDIALKFDTNLKLRELSDQVKLNREKSLIAIKELGGKIEVYKILKGGRVTLEIPTIQIEDEDKTEVEYAH